MLDIERSRSEWSVLARAVVAAQKRTLPRREPIMIDWLRWVAGHPTIFLGCLRRAESGLDPLLTFAAATPTTQNSSCALERKAVLLRGGSDFFAPDA